MRTLLLRIAGWAGIFAAAFFVAAPPAHAALDPVDGSFAVESLVSQNTIDPRVAIDSSGGFRVAWQTYVSGVWGWDVHVRGFHPDGSPAGSEFDPTSDPIGHQGAPAISIGPKGGFLVAWEAAKPAPLEHAWARVFTKAGSPMGDEFPLGMHEIEVSQYEPSAAADGEGFVVAWRERERVAAERRSADGALLGDFEYPVTKPQHVAVAALPGGNAALAWSTSHEVYAHDGWGEVGYVDGVLFDAAGAVLDGFRANEGRGDPSYEGYVVDGEARVSLASDARGSFSVCWDSQVPSYVYNADEWVDGFNIGAGLERFDGVESAGSVFLAPQPDDAGVPDVAVSPGGNVVAVYGGEGAFLRAFDCHGEDIGGGPVEVDVERPGYDTPTREGSVAVNEAGNVVVVWRSQREDKTGTNVFGQLFHLSGGCDLCGDANANGRITAVDALLALQTSVGTGDCPMSRCDTNASQEVTSGDAFRILRFAVDGGSVELVCTEEN